MVVPSLFVDLGIEARLPLGGSRYVFGGAGPESAQVLVYEAPWVAGQADLAVGWRIR
jgi:hypothetical protein